MVRRFRCHTGRAFSLGSVLGAMSDSVEESLIDTVRSLEEGVMLLEDIAERAGTCGHTKLPTGRRCDAPMSTWRPRINT